MDEKARNGSPDARTRVALLLRYACTADARRDRLRDVPRGIVARTSVPVRAGDPVDVRIEVAAGAASVSARGEVAWARPLASETIAGLSLVGDSHRDEVKLDLLLGVRTIGAGDTAPYPTADAHVLYVVMLEPDPVLRQALVTAIERFAHEKSCAGLRLETTSDASSFVAVAEARRPDLAIIDCDGIDEGVEPLVGAIRPHAESERVPVIILSEERFPNLEDRCTVTMRKPVWMKALLHTADLLLRG